MSLNVPEFNRDSFDHLNRSVYDFWTAFALSLMAALVSSDIGSAYLDQFGPSIKAVGTLALAIVIFTPAPVVIGLTILEGKDENYIKHLMDFPLHPGGVMVDFVEQGIIDLVTQESEVPKVQGPTPEQPGTTTDEAKIPKNPALLSEVVQAKALGFFSFAVHVEVPQRWITRRTILKLLALPFIAIGLGILSYNLYGIAGISIGASLLLAGFVVSPGTPPYQPVDDIVFHSPVPRSAAIVPENGSGTYKGVSMRKLAHQSVIGSTFLKTIKYSIGSKPVPIFRITFCRGISLAAIKGVKLSPVTEKELAEVTNAYSTLGSVTLKMDNDRLGKENEELRQQAQNDNWNNHVKAAEVLRQERSAFGGEPLRQSTWKWLQTGRGLAGLTIVTVLAAIFLFFLNAWFQTRPHP